MRRISAGSILPRDRHAASRALACLLLAGAAFVGSLTLLLPGFAGKGPLPNILSALTAVLLGVTGTICWRIPERVPAFFWVGAPVIATVVIAGLNLVSRDASTGAQLFFLWPVLYAATFLRGAIIHLALGSVAIAEVAVVFPLLERNRAISDALGLITALGMATVVIVILRRRVDRLLAALERQALEDPLTGLANRRAFEQDLARAVAGAQESGRPLSLLAFDLDHFKNINDGWGHATGDAALQAVAAAMRGVCRTSDLCARLGGDEFVMIIDSDSVGACRIADTLRRAVGSRTDIVGGPPTLSIGVATIPEHADTAEALLAGADTALYRAKQTGRDRLAVAESSRRPRPSAAAYPPSPVSGVVVQEPTGVAR
ncbi:MAG TPA: GGDEF domain-containing protein [Catenuloplanes sp.]|jgi:diguanylate cyclase (GGDEF)-like protein